ncbi:MAG: glutamate-cysteine ligase family protein [Candidatus Neomarinimicrobiota bacterium]|nr:glutamate-cysteine ligase family protein [Candidatus Neomarinimicrobiota bacterium]
MNLSDKIKSMILSKTVSEKERKIGVEIESFYYNHGSLNRIPVNKKDQYSASDLLFDINQATADHQYTYSLEPGGQLEWASSPHISLWDIADEYSNNMLAQRQLCKKNHIDIGYFSVEPVSDPFEIELIDSKKYHLMDNLFHETGTLGPWMMRNTTSIQVNIDYTNERDANQMAFIADSIQPLVSILFANAPFIKNKLAKSDNLRWKIWNNTDSSRCGSLFEHTIDDSNNVINNYVEWLQSRQAIFIENPQGTFNEFNNDLAAMISSDNNDDLIYSAFRQIFTHVRFKTVLEVRASDRQQKGKELVPAAFLAGLLTSNIVRDKLLDEINSWTIDDKINLSKQASELSFSNIGPKQKSIGYWLEFLGQLALEGLDERSKIFDIKNERPLLEFELNNLIASGPDTITIQNKYNNSNQTLKSFIIENYLDSFED